MKIDPDFMPCEVKDNDEIFPNGIFLFNISRMLEDIDSGELVVLREKIDVMEWFRTHCDGSINEGYMPDVELSRPVIQAEIKHDRFEIIDGNHRMTKALRDGILFVDSYKILGEQLPQYLTSVERYKSYINYWNDKLKD